MQDRRLQDPLSNNAELIASHEKPFVGKTVMVTGGSGGIGAEICREFARQGASRIVTVSRPQGLGNAGAVATELTAMGVEVFWIGVDLSTREAPSKIIEEIEKLGIDRIDVLVNNAGVSGENRNYSYEEKQAMMRTNYFSAVALTRGLQSKFSPNASIINISSTAGIWEDIDQPTYSKTKKLLIEMARTWSKTPKFQSGMRINVIAPGFVDGTGMTRNIPQEAKDVVIGETPNGLATIDAIARKVCEIARPDSTTNGELFIEDGDLGIKTPDVLRKAYREGAKALIAKRRAEREAATQTPK